MNNMNFARNTIATNLRSDLAEMGIEMFAPQWDDAAQRLELVMTFGDSYRKELVWDVLNSIEELWGLWSVYVSDTLSAEDANDLVDGTAPFAIDRLQRESDTIKDGVINMISDELTAWRDDDGDFIFNGWSIGIAMAIDTHRTDKAISEVLREFARFNRFLEVLEIEGDPDACIEAPEGLFAGEEYDTRHLFPEDN